ncbi:MAG: hypothetical protein AUJ70_05440 [Candidatus Omnitrophica bacterium CG1_02_40_15]|nr:MAG: hypothetical protein AUJ70_05440 [Candidatus Omnitrophica bacterium CG1_02_40_15]
MSKKQPFVSIIVVNFNGKKLIKKCLDSLFKIDYPDRRFEIIVVDNCSQDDSVKFIKHKYKKVRVIENRQNNYCQACNLGILKSKGSYIVLLNNDVVVKKNWLSELVKPIEKDKSIGAVTSMLLKKNGVIQNAGLYELPNFYWDERGAGKKPEKYASMTEIDAISGACALYRKAALKDIGLLDEDFVMFGEDVDMAIRFKKKGWKLEYTPFSTAYHKKHGSCNEEFTREAVEKNRLLLIAKHYPDKLTNALIGNGHFIVKEGKQKSGRFFELLPDIFIKLAKEHGHLAADGIMKDAFVELEKILNYENKKLEEEIKNLLDDLIETKKDREHYKKQEENYKKDIEEVSKNLNGLSQNLNTTQNELQAYKDEVSNLSNKLKISLGKRR